MRLQFLDRDKEIGRLRRALAADEPAFVVLYGRRRCGKSTLLQQVARSQDVYFLADRREAPLQIRALAREIARQVADFNAVEYPSWEALLQTLNVRAEGDLCLILDEFPYLVQMAPELPSLLQNFIDRRERKFSLIICGSSQRMMQGLVLDASAPLYGRATEVLKIRPLEPGWIQDALQVEGVQAVEAYGVWGGVPRCWELAREFGSQEEGVKELVLDRDGLLNSEPERLLIDDLRSTTQAHSLLSLVANGCHRLSEVASRLGKPAGSLSRPLAHLIDMGYLRRELPWGESEKSTKRSLYKLDDPFLRLWYRYVQTNRSLLERDLVDAVYADMQRSFSAHVAAVWEDLARESAVRLEIAGKRWRPAQRWWGRGLNGKNMEIDLVALSLDGRSLLLGEVKWEQRTNVGEVIEKLKQGADNFPHIDDREVVLACWLRQSGGNYGEGESVFVPEDVIPVLR